MKGMHTHNVLNMMDGVHKLRLTELKFCETHAMLLHQPHAFSSFYRNRFNVLETINLLLRATQAI